MIKIPCSRQLAPDEVKQIVHALTEQLKAMGHRPDVLMQAAGVILLTHGMAVMDCNPGARDAVQNLTDAYRAVLSNVTEMLFHYRDSEDYQVKVKAAAQQREAAR